MQAKHQKVTYWSFFNKIASKIEFFRRWRYPFGQSCLLIWIFYVSNHDFNGCGEKNNLIMQRISKKSTSGSTLVFILLRLFWVFLQNYFKLQIFFVIRYRHLFLIHRWKGQHYLISFTITNSHKQSVRYLILSLSFYSTFYFYLIVITTKATFLSVFAHLFSVCCWPMSWHALRKRGTI